MELKTNSCDIFADLPISIYRVDIQEKKVVKLLSEV